MELRDFSITKGDTKLIDVSVTEQSDGTPTTITSSTIAWKVAKSIRTSAVISKTTASGISITSGSGGTFRITLDAADTSSLDPGDYYHEAQITFADSEVATVLKGIMTIEPGLV